MWFDTEATEAVALHTSVFGGQVTSTTMLRDTPSGDGEVITFELDGQPFMAINAGPYFKLNPSISFIVNYDPARFPDAEERLNTAWAKLLPEGTVRMDLTTYPFSKRYGWIEDRFGVNWQLMLTDPEGEPRPFITPSMMFTGENAGRAEEAIDFYCAIFPDGMRGQTARYPTDTEHDKAGTVMFADFSIRDTWLAAMDSGHPHGFTFNEALSFLVECPDQAEIDRLWAALSAVPEAEQCGWVKDKFGVSWQIVPEGMQRMLADSDEERAQRVLKAVLAMKKIDRAALERAYAGG